jgi:hypothetical protein
MLPKALLSLAVLVTMAAAVPASYEWRTRPDHPGYYYLFKNGTQVGGYCVKGQYYRPYDARTDVWGERCRPPHEPPVSDNFGVRHDKRNGQSSYRVNGREVSREQVLQALQDARLPDDRALLRLTVIGPDAERQRVVNDLRTHPALAPFQGQLVVHDYPPTHWAVQCGFKTDGRPTIYLQQPDGTVLHRQDDYGGPEQLAAALRRAQPNYNPKNDPDRSKLLPWLPRLVLSKVPAWAWVAAGAALVLLLRKETKP